MKKLALLLIVLFTIFGIQETQSPKQPVREKVWTKEDSKAYARDRLAVWTSKQYSCLNKLWTMESHWNPKAYNRVKVMGRNAGGIPQLLGMSPKTLPTEQIERGLDYIYYRYTTPCRALAYHYKHGWY